MPTELLTPEETADLLGVRPKTLARWRWRGKGPEFCKVGRKVRYPHDAVEEYLRQSRRRSTSDPGPRECPGQTTRRSTSGPGQHASR